MNTKYFSVFATALAMSSLGCSGVDGQPDTASESVGEASEKLVIAKNAICARGGSGIYCALSNGVNAFGASTVWQSALAMPMGGMAGRNTTRPFDSRT
jgi:hypothetical protein